LIFSAGKAEILCDTGISKVRQRSLVEKATSGSTRKFFELVIGVKIRALPSQLKVFGGVFRAEDF